ncbi:MAG: 2OG-Fe(II) oxygenase [Burkholderiales bacterium]|nr:2OG-Fe(II) oxygenase [Burkholderiales bacterium]
MGRPLKPLPWGEPAPWFVTPSLANPNYHFNTVAGRHVLLFFAASLRLAPSAALLQELLANRALFDDVRCSLFVVTLDAEDVAQARVRDHVPGVRVLCDYDASVSRQFGIAAPLEGGHLDVQPSAVLLDPTLRVMQWWFAGTPNVDVAAHITATVAALPLPLAGPAQLQAPVIVVPRVFEPAFCRELIAYYESRGGEDSGYMRRDPDGFRGVIDYGVKRRSDCTIEDERLRRGAMLRITRRLKPQIERAFRFEPTRMERYLVACYEAEPGGYFRPHRDNDGGGHRQFAVTLNLNAEDYEGGDLCFPEYGQLTYRAPTGGACVFSCMLLHEARPVTRGKRYAFLPFLYDEAAAARREANNAQYPDPRHHYSRQPGGGNPG